MNDNNTGWQYKPDGEDPVPETDEDNPSPASRPSTTKDISWEASEFIDHPHGGGWYLTLLVSTLVLAAAVFFLTSHDKFATAIIVILGVIVGVFANQKPRVVKYEISDSGLKIGDKFYDYSHFKSFAVMHEGPLTSINLLPLKRLVPPISAYFDPKEEQKIVNALGNYLPYEERKLDSIDRLTRRLRL